MKMKLRSLVLIMACLITFTMANASSEQSRASTPSGSLTFNCPFSGYDHGSVDDAIFFGGGHAGDSEYIMGTIFRLADFNLFPHRSRINGLCVSNQLAFAGGPWPNEIFVYPDLGNDLPDIDNPLTHATILTGNGSGDVYIQFDPPIDLDGDFWLAVRGDPIHEGEDFNLEIEVPKDPELVTGNSYLTDIGLNFWHQTGGNWLIRADLEATAPPPAIPAIGARAIILLVILFLVAAFAPLWRSRNK
ncbi:MAG: hypothetical protein ACWA5R_02400 [bacterium]